MNLGRTGTYRPRECSWIEKENPDSDETREDAVLFKFSWNGDYAPTWALQINITEELIS